MFIKKSKLLSLIKENTDLINQIKKRVVDIEEVKFNNFADVFNKNLNLLKDDTLSISQQLTELKEASNLHQSQIAILQSYLLTKNSKPKTTTTKTSKEKKE